MKTCFWIFGLLTIGGAVWAQPAIEWQKTFGGSDYDDGVSIVQTPEGGYTLLGGSYSGDDDLDCQHGIIDFSMIRLGVLGEQKWHKCMGGSLGESPYDIKVCPDGGYVMVGYSDSNDGDLSNNYGDFDGWIVKSDQNGNIQWQRSIGGSGEDRFLAVAITIDHGYIVTGISDSGDGDGMVPAGNDVNVWVVKLDSSGQVEWHRNYGGTSEDVGYSVVQTEDGGYIIAGRTTSNDGDVSGNHGNVDGWVIKLRSNGDLEWQKAVGSLYADQCRRIVETDDGYVIVGIAGSNTGDVTGWHGSFDVWVVKLDFAGNILWQKSIGGTADELGQAAALTPNGEIVVAGPTKSTDGDIQNFYGIQDINVFKLSKNGELLWQKTIGGSDGESCNSIAVTEDGGYILAGNTWSHDGDVTGSINRGKNDFWVIKLAPETLNANAPQQTQTLNISPNPAQDAISIQLPDSEQIIRTSIFNSNGLICLETSDHSGRIPVSGLARGMYFVAVATQTGRIFTGKFIK